MEPDSVKKYHWLFPALRFVTLGLSAILILAGGLGMLVGLLYFASPTMEDAIIGGSGLFAGSVLIGSGIISLALTCRPVARAIR